MKKLFMLSALLIGNYVIGQVSQVDIPFYEPFESNYDGCPQNTTCQWQEQYFDDQIDDRIVLESYDSNYSSSLKLTVRDGDYTGDTDDGRDRTEIALWSENNIIEEGDTFYYSWDFYIPSQTFAEVSGQSEFYYFIMQWHHVNNDNAPDDPCCEAPDEESLQFPQIQLRYIPENNAPDNKRDLFLNMGTQYDWCGGTNNGRCTNDNYSEIQKKYHIYDAVNEGEWNHIVTKIKWSYDGDDAEMKMWINDKPLVYDSNNSPADCFNDGNVVVPVTPLKVGTSELLPTYSLNGAPLLYLQDCNNAPIVRNNYNKLGHYRKNYQSDNTMYVDNYRITKEYPPSPKKTFLVNPDCDNQDGCNKYTITSTCSFEFAPGDDHVITAYEVEPSSHYVFKIVDGNNTFYDGSFTNTLDLLNENWARAGESYDISVRGVHTGFIHDRACTVTTASKTRLIDGQYEHDINFAYDVPENYAGGELSCTPLAGATNYLFQFTNVNDISNIFWLETATGETTVNIYDSHQLKENAWYKVSVRGRRMENGTDTYSGLGYGDIGYIKINNNPMLTELTTTYCNQTTTSSSIYCNSVDPADSYTFEFTDSNGAVNYAGSLSTSINVTTQSWFNYNELYNVKVRAVYNNGVNGFPYGHSCTILFVDPNPGDDKFTNSSGKQSLAKPEINPNPFIDQIEIKGADENNYMYSVFDFSGNLVKKGNTASTNKVDLHDFVSGIYFLRLEKANDIFIYKLIKH